MSGGEESCRGKQKWTLGNGEKRKEGEGDEEKTIGKGKNRRGGVCKENENGKR